MGDDEETSFGWRVFGGLTALGAGIAARKGLAAVWQKVTGKEPPANPAVPGTSWPEAIAWALVSGSVYALARMAAERKAADTWRRASGSLPPGAQKTT